MLINFLSNAIKFTPARGRIVVRVSRIGDGISLAVIDAGIGIPADKLTLVFDRFLQVNGNDRRGVGLGLYISKSIVQGHGGRIWAESYVGRGEHLLLHTSHPPARLKTSRPRSTMIPTYKFRRYGRTGTTKTAPTRRFGNGSPSICERRALPAL